MHVSRLKFLTILTITILAFLLAIPSFLSPAQRSAIPSWVPYKTVNLGLDLQGGSYLLLGVQTEDYIKDQLLLIQDDIRRELRNKRIGYAQLALRYPEVVFSLREEGDIDATLQALRGLGAYVNVSNKGTNFTLTFAEPYLQELNRKVMDQSVEIVRRRVDETGTKEPIIQRQGEDRILLQVPGLENPEHLKRLLGKTAKLSFHLVDVNSMGAGASQTVPLDSMRLPVEGEGVYYVVKKQAMITGDLLADATTSFGQTGEPVVSFRFNTIGARKFGEITRAHVGEPFAIVLDNKIISAPVIREPILGGSGQISGNFTTDSANDLAVLLRAGALPAPLKVLEERSVGPSLGADSIASGEFSALVAIVLVIVFMFLSYGRLGMYANVALCINVAMIMAALSLLQATLTLPGIAGIVLTMGMAVDANVLIFERVREELDIGRTPFSAVEKGFDQAFMTIVDSNITTLIGGVLLFFLGDGPVKGFGVTLSIGILTSMFSSMVITKAIVAMWLRRARPKTLVL